MTKVLTLEEANNTSTLHEAYVAGPMRGYPEFNFPAFDAAAALLRGMGFRRVVSPADLDRAIGFDPKKDTLDGFDLDAAIDRDIGTIRQLNRETGCVVVLPGWEKSVGARAEVAYAVWRGITVVLLPGAEPAVEPTPPKTTACAVAQHDGGTLPHEAGERKKYPVVTGVIDYFPDAIAEVAFVSKVGNDQHNPGQPLHWAREKSTDHADCIGRHLIQRGTRDVDGTRHSAKLAWRALALLQTEIEKERQA